jgi:histidinol-phosphate aminotransferase
LGGRKVESRLAGIAVDLDDALDKVDETTDAVWICSPNNPTAGVVQRDDMDRFLSRLPENVLVVLDEAYYEFVTDPCAAHAEHYFGTDNRVVGLRTFSKAFALAGLRIGYLTAHPDMIALMERVRLPFNVNLAAQAAALAVMDDKPYVDAHVALITGEREFLRVELANRGMDVPASQTNFLFFETPVNSREAFKKLMAQGVIIRPGDIWGKPNHLRVTVGSREQNEMFLSALDKVLAEE